MNINQIKQQIKQQIKKELDNPKLKLNITTPPKPEMGDLCLACFDLDKNPQKTAQQLAKKIKSDFISKTTTAGPYINFKLNFEKLAPNVIKKILKTKKNYGQVKPDKKKKIIMEFAHPNTHKAFHIGHLRNIVTGESLARILEKNGHNVIRANYQGDIGLHIAKCLWAVKKNKQKFEQIKNSSLKLKIKFLGQCYAQGAKAYEKNKKSKQQIKKINKQIYNQDKKIKEIYEITRRWSLNCFEKIYHRVYTKFDRLYFESQVFEKGKSIVQQNTPKIFKKSQGTVVFPGEKYGLHTRVFINSAGQPTYEAKDIGLAYLQMHEFKPDKIIHLTGPEQKDYFTVIFKALEQIRPESKNKQKYLPYGWVRLKKGKMSSRKGKVVLGEWLIDQIKKTLNKQKNISSQDIAEKIALSAVKYSILKNSREKEIAFDIKQSIKLSGNSGPYIQYTYARIQSILKKVSWLTNLKTKKSTQPNKINKKEKQLILQMSLFDQAILKAGKNFEPYEIAKYLFKLTQLFNDYYHSIPILQANKKQKMFRLRLIKAIAQIIQNGLDLLGIKTVKKM